jgi:hypothetical protein
MAELDDSAERAALAHGDAAPGASASSAGAAEAPGPTTGPSVVDQNLRVDVRVLDRLAPRRAWGVAGGTIAAGRPADLAASPMAGMHHLRRAVATVVGGRRWEAMDARIAA